MKISFVLPGRGGGGGAHSVVQESAGLKRLGVDVGIATTTETLQDFQANYPELVQGGVRLSAFSGPQELAKAIEGCDLALATTAPSTHLLGQALAGMGEAKPRTGYYIQDYEPLFFTPGTPEWTAARASYLALPGAPLLFAKTRWLCSVVDDNHGRQTAKVSPSLDHAIYHPGPGPAPDRLTICAMIRPKTPRRAPRRTVRILERLAAKFGDRVQVLSFGCDRAELDAAGIRLSDRIEHAGPLSRQQVAALMRRAGLFLDLSDYQAFGRTGLEAMACGCTPVLPVFGGAAEYVRHGRNGYMVDTRSDEAVLALVDEHVGLSPAATARMRRQGLATALDYSVERAAFSEYDLFSRFLDKA